MRRGVHIPADVRDDMARRALEIYTKAPSRAAALANIEVEFNVSNPTARNLVSRGYWLVRRVIG